MGGFRDLLPCGGEWRPWPVVSHGVTNNNTAVPRFYYYVNTEYTHSEYI